MRDLLLLLIVAPGCLMALRHPFVGALLWVWVGTMNPHRLAFGFMREAPIAAVIAVCILIGMLRSPEKRSPWVAPPVTWFAVLIGWMCLTTAFAIHPNSSFNMLQKVLKIDLMIFVTIMLVRSRREIIALAWVLAGSMAFYGIKGGIFTLASGGAYRVWGPDGTYIQENNALAVALIMTVPLLRFLQTTLKLAWQRHAMTVAMLLCAASVLGSHSRGAVLSIAAMLAVLWWRGRNKLATALVMLVVGAAALSFMPEHWWNRMHTIETYEQDQSAMGRINAWSMAANLAQSRPMGGGYSIWRPDVFARYAPNPSFVVSAHSIYFHMLGEHGFIGLGLYLCFWISTWRSAGWLRKHGAQNPENDWCAQLGAMAQVALVGFAVGGAFLSLAYYDLPLHWMVLVVATRYWVESGLWKQEPPMPPARKLLGVPLFTGDRLAGSDVKKPQASG